MNTDDTVTNAVDIDDVNLDEFEQDFFNPKAEVVEEEVVDEEIGDDHPAADEDEDTDEDETEEDESDESDEEDDDEEDEEPEEDPKPKRNRKSAKERIEELVAKTRETERAADRREAELLERIKNLEARTDKEESQPKDVKALLPPEAPTPDATGKDGEPLYPLGEFDPLYIRDLTKFTIEQERTAMREQEALDRQAREEQAVRQQIADEWMDRVEEAEKTIPELRDNMKTLTDTFATLEPNYGEYLASTIMISEVGPQIMNYLSQNIGEAQKIVASGPAAATLALGRLEARLLNSSTPQEEKRNTKQVSKAPAPPTDRARGSGGKFAVAPDTDDLDAFERVFYK